jgi:GNAT superfamily N-acetyltransferase
VTAVLVRRIRDVEELAATFAVLDRQFDDQPADPGRRLDEPLGRFAEDRTMQLVVLDGDRIRGGVVAFRRGGGHGVTVRNIGLDEALRGRGIGRLLLELVELEAITLGCREIHLGAVDDARGFYEAMGYRGKHTMRSKALPAPGRVTDLRLAKAWARLGDPDLDAGFSYDPGALAGSTTTNATPGSSSR